MMSSAKAAMEEQAIGWVIRTRDPDFAAWEEFADWLERDAEHRRLYDEFSAADAELGDALRSVPRPLPQPQRRGVFHPSRRGVIGWAVAASLVAVVGYSTLAPGSSPYSVETAPGARQTVTLADGSRIDLNGSTRLVLDREKPRLARLERGEALFTVVHDDARPFIVEVGDATIMDVGTVFNVTRTEQLLQVAVAEGEVVYNPKAEKVRLTPGRALRAAAGEDRIWTGPADPQAIGAWRGGRLIYDGTPLVNVAADLTRNLGVPVTAAPSAAGRSFSGVIRLDADRDRAVRHAAALMGVEARRDRQGWILTARSNEAR